MLTKTLLAFSIVCNFATLLGLWLGYTSASAPVQERFGHILLTCGAIASIACYVVFAIFVLRPKTHEPKPVNGQAHIYIGPGGTPIQLYNEKLRIDIRFFACGTLQLLHVKLRLGSPKEFAVTLSDAEPHEITAGQVLSKRLERLLTDEELAVLKSDIVLVQGTAKFGGNLEVPFVFSACPARY